MAKGNFDLAVFSEILFEYQEIIEQKFSVSTANAFISLLKELPNVHFYTAFYKWLLIDEDDNKYADCAIAGRAYYLISEDKHFKLLKTISFPKVSLLSINEFMALSTKNKKK
ncbi:PIN domain-containing protein [Niabella ginsenosidivorans]|uniref:PIN domain-containing protein n=1 Tax=Niabella ginsenosidivorans TaxID=1176587 RepID=UPI0009FD5C40|nr:PIN family protein [Niabella ginsenosidivorans]